MIAGGGGVMVNVRFVVAICAGEPESVTLNVSATFVIAAVGVPLTCPVDVFSVKPAGSEPAVSAQV